jgi:membrane fusion protein (multidrug efflux system)
MGNENSEVKGQQPPKAERRRRKRLLIPVLLLVVAAAVVVFYWYEFLRGYVGTDDAVIDSDAVTISSKILGRIALLHADEGDSVAAGELLVQIDDSDLRAQEAQARANLDYVQQNVQVTQITLEQARDDFYRDSVQFQSNVITRQQFDHARQALDMARAQQAVALSHVKAAQAQLAVIETQLDNTRISASVSGVVARKWVVLGDIVQPGQPIFTLFDLHDVWVTANFEETKLARIRPGDFVEISVDAIPGRKLPGKVELIGAAAASQFSLIPPNNASGNFTKVTQRVPVKIVFSDLDRDDPGQRTPLLPGMSVEVRIRIAEN